MSSRKLERLTIQAIERLGVEVVESANKRGHYQMTLKLPDGEQRKIAVSCSPTVLEHTINAVTQQVKRMLRS